MVCLWFEPGAAGWQAQMKPLSYGGHNVCNVLLFNLFLVCLQMNEILLLIVFVYSAF